MTLNNNEIVNVTCLFILTLTDLILPMVEIQSCVGVKNMHLSYQKA